MTEQFQETYPEMVKRICKSGEAIQETLTPDVVDLVHNAIGLMGEVIELEEGIANADPENILEEAGDCCFYLLALTQNDLISPDKLFERTFNGDVEVGLIPAAGDILDIVKKIFAYNDLTKIDDLITAIAQFMTSFSFQTAKLDFALEEAYNHNQNKLTGKGGRYEQGYSDKAAEERADKKGDDS